jgi:hypothetical protein
METIFPQDHEKWILLVYTIHLSEQEGKGMHRMLFIH